MATDAQNTQRWESTSAPVINHDKSADRWRLELNNTPKKKKTARKRSAWYTTREEAEASASWWRLSWEQGNSGKKINPGTQPDEPRRNSSGSSPADVELPPGKLCNELYEWVWYAAVPRTGSATAVVKKS